jgi:quinoprotein glucose dehydrogenase
MDRNRICPRRLNKTTGVHRAILNSMKRVWLIFILVAAFAVGLYSAHISEPNEEWPIYGHDYGGQRFSPLTGINRSNVSSLKVAWTFHTGDAYQPKESRATAFEATPIYVGNTLYIGTPLGRVIALDPLTGKRLWAYDPHIDRDKGYGDYANRGVSVWESPGKRSRVFIATIDARLIALDAKTGELCQDFGDNGIVNLRQGLRIGIRGYADYEETSPPAIVGRTVIVGSGIADNGATYMPSGEVRGFDAVTGAKKWTWDPIPQDPHAIGANTWKNGSAARTGAANAWSVIVADPVHNLIFVPTGSASPDYYGGERLGANLFADSVVALNPDTGRMVWYFQTVHHDLWDYDVASPPLLFNVHRDGQTIPAVAAGSKTGNLFILNRYTGKPIFGVEERPVPQSDVPGEKTSSTQPFPVLPKPVTPQKMTVADAWGIDESDRNWCRAEIEKLRTDGVFTPPSLRGSLMMPGNIGGMAWGGVAYDELHDLLILPENHLASEVRLIPRDKFDEMRAATHKNEGRLINGDWEFARQLGTPYGMMRRFLRSPDKGLPCTPPPWGTLLAISASTGEKKWAVPLGEFAPGHPEFGSPSLGGPIVTAGGLVFTAGTFNPAIYAFNSETGKQLWKGVLPDSARATPMTYEGPDRRQYVVISAGGHGLSAPGDSLVAFAIDKNKQ